MSTPPTSPGGHSSFGETDLESAGVRTTLAKAKLAEEKAIEKAMQNGLRMGRLIRREQAMAVIAKLGGGVRSSLLRLPEELVEGLPPEVADELRLRIANYMAKRIRPLFETAIDSVDVITDPHASRNATKVATADGGTAGILGD